MRAPRRMPAARPPPAADTGEQGKEAMKTHARVVVIGGGVVGVSTLYHLTKKGWSDVVLLERTELTAGSTWHAAGLLPLFNMSYTVGQLHKYSVDLYKRLPAETGQDVGFHVTGNLRLATCRDRLDEYHKYCGTANTIGVPFEVIGPAQVKELWPLVELGDGVGHAEDRRRALSPARRPHRAGRSHDGAAQGRPRRRRRDLRADRGARRRAHAVRRVARAYRAGRHRLRARRLRDRQLRARDGPDVRARRAGDSGRAPVHRLRRVGRARRVPRGRRPRARRAARVRRVVLPARGAHGLDPRALREGRAGALRRRRPRASSAGSSSPATSTGCCRTSRRR